MFKEQEKCSVGASQDGDVVCYCRTCRGSSALLQGEEGVSRGVIRMQRLQVEVSQATYPN